jgi:hypothetical protein
MADLIALLTFIDVMLAGLFGPAIVVMFLYQYRRFIDTRPDGPVDPAVLAALTRKAFLPRLYKKMLDESPQRRFMREGEDT